MLTIALPDLADHILDTLKDAGLTAHQSFGQLTIHADADHLLETLKLLRADPLCLFEVLIDICGVDYPERKQRFEVVYHLLSPRLNQRIRLKVSTDEKTPVPSAIGLFPAANWFEREAYDLFGILFTDHPDLRRILTDYGFRGHPLRKDFPMSGYVEVRYDDEQKKVIYEPIKLPQDFRSFDFLSPWEGAEYLLPGDEKKS
jgi:NADH-quinone oxidoreductase subunit C